VELTYNGVSLADVRVVSVEADDGPLFTLIQVRVEGTR
jgi:hypothetical protein